MLARVIASPQPEIIKSATNKPAVRKNNSMIRRFVFTCVAFCAITDILSSCQEPSNSLSVVTTLTMSCLRDISHRPLSGAADALFDFAKPPLRAHPPRSRRIAALETPISPFSRVKSTARANSLSSYCLSTLVNWPTFSPLATTPDKAYYVRS